MKLGNKDISNIYLGSKEIDKIYLGSKEIFSSEIAPNGSPSELVATVLSDTSIKCDWTNGATNQDGTYLYYSLDGVTNWQLGATVVGSGTTGDITGLTENTTYYVRTAHFKGSKLSEYSNISNSTTHIPSQSDLNLWTIGRSGLSMIDSISSNNPSILPSCGLIDTNNYATLSVSNFEVGDSSGFIEAKCYFDGSTNNHILFSSSDTGSAARIFVFIISSKYLYLVVRGQSPTAFANIIKTTDIIGSAGWYTLKAVSNGSAYSLYVNGINKTSLTTVIGNNDGKWLNLSDSRDNIGIGVNVYNTTDKSTTFKIAWVNYNDKHKWYVTGFGNYIFDSIGTNHLTWNGSSHIFYDSNASSELLDNGYSLWSKTGSSDEYVPYKSGNPNDVSAFLTGYSKSSDHAGSSTEHNLAISKIRFIGDNWDRSNTTIFSALARSGYYDSSNHKDFNIRELTSQILISFYNVGYQGLNFVRNNSLTLSEILGYNNNKIGNNCKSIYNYLSESSIYFENFDGIFKDSFEYSDKTTYKIRSSHSVFKFSYDDSKLYVMAKSTLYANYPTYAYISIFINGVYNQRVQYTTSDADYKEITLPEGSKIVELVEPLLSRINDTGDQLGVFIQSIHANSTFIKLISCNVSEKVVFLGDSITVGANATNTSSECFARLFNVENSKEVEVLGWGYAKLKTFAIDASTILSTVASITSAFNNVTTTKKLIIALGTNDAGLDSTASATFKTWYGNLLDSINASDSNIEIYCISPINRGDSIHNALIAEYRLAISDICSSRIYATYINGANILTYPTGYSDAVHPNTSGHKAYKDYIYPIINS